MACSRSVCTPLKTGQLSCIPLREDALNNVVHHIHIRLNRNAATHRANFAHDPKESSRARLSPDFLSSFNNTSTSSCDNSADGNGLSCDMSDDDDEFLIAKSSDVRRRFNTRLWKSEPDDASSSLAYSLQLCLPIHDDIS